MEKMMGGKFKKPSKIAEADLWRGSEIYTRLPLICEQPWDSVDGNGWYYQKRGGDVPARITTDFTAPHSPDNVLEINFHGVPRDTDPGVHWISLPHCTRVYWEYWMKISSTWQASPAGFCKIHFLFPPEGGDLYHAAFGTLPPYGSTDSKSFPVYMSGGQLQWPSDEATGIPTLPNSSIFMMDRGKWYHHAGYVDLEAKVWRWWVNDKLCGNVANIPIPKNDMKLIEFQIAMTIQEPCEIDNQFAWFDHIILRGE